MHESYLLRLLFSRSFEGFRARGTLSNCPFLARLLECVCNGGWRNAEANSVRYLLSFTKKVLRQLLGNCINCVPTVHNFEHFPFHLPIWQPYLNGVFGCTRMRLSAPTKLSFLVDGDKQSNRPVLRV